MAQSLTKTFLALRQNPWPYAIAGWLVLFASGLAAWAVVALRQNLDLVRPDYYDEEIRYQQQIDRLNRTAPWRSEVSVASEAGAGRVILRLPAGHAARALTGKVKFYRPSNARLDFEQPLAVDAAGVQRVETGRLEPGLWQVQLHWTVDGNDYYFDQKLVL